MFKGYRGPLLAFVAALILFGLVIATKPPDVPPSTPGVTLVTATTIPFMITPAPTISIQQIDTTTLHEGLIGSPKKINPLLAGYNKVDRDLCALIFEGLMTTDAYGAAVPDLAAAQPTVSGDGLVYAVTLRSDVLWQDGVPFSSADVAYTINLMQDSAFPGPAEYHTFWQTVELDVLDEHRVRFRLAQPLAAFTDYLRIGILPEHALHGTSAAALLTHPFNVSPIGTGPYQFDSWFGVNGQISGVRLRVAPTYRQRPEGQTGYALEHLAFHFYPSFDAAVAAFQRGEVFSISELPPNSIQPITSSLPQMATYQQYRPAFGAVIYNWQNNATPFFRDLRFRQALTRAVNREALVNQFMAGRAVPADSPILPDSWAYDNTVNCTRFNPYDPADAKKSLSLVQILPTVPPPAPAAGTQNASATAVATAAATSQATGVPIQPTQIKFELLVQNDPAMAGMAQELIKAWANIGLTVQITVVDPPTFNGRLVKGDFDAALVELNLAPSADPDPYSLWRQIPADGGLNFGGLNERRLSELMEAARREAANGLVRASLYKQFQQLFCERASALLLYDPVFFYGADSRITGIQLGFIAEPSDRFRTIKDWKFAKS